MQEHFPEQPVIPAQVGYRVGFDEFLDGYYDPSDQLREWVYESTRRRLDAGQSSLDAVDTVDGLDQRVAAMRRLLLESFGGGVRPAAPLIVTESPRVCDGGQVAAVELVVTGRTGLAIPATVYEPGSRTAPGDAVLILCGHAPEAREYGPFVQLARSLARAGILAVVADPIAQGGRRWHDWEASAQACLAPVDRVLETHNELGVRGWWAGVSLQRYFAEDAMTMVDYLVSRPDVDPARIGVTGSSGGGVQAALLMMLDPRIAAAAPANFISSRRAYLGAGSAQDGEQIFPTLSAAGFDHADILAAMAPRPVLVAAGNYDFFPVEGAIATVERARRLYSLHGAADRLHLVRTDAGHGYNTELIDAVTGFFKANLPANCPPPGPRRAVAVTVGQATRPGADEADRLGELLSEDFPGVDPDVDAARAWLAERISHRSRRPLAALYPRWTVARRIEGTRARSVAAREFHWTEQGILNAGVYLRPENTGFDRLRVVLHDRGTSALEELSPFLDRLLATRSAVYVLDVRGVGAVTPRPVNFYPMHRSYGTLFKLMTDLVGIDDSLLYAQAFDLLRAFELVTTDPFVCLDGRPVDLVAAGNVTLVALAAAVVSPLVAEVAVCGPAPDPVRLVAQRGGDQALWPLTAWGFARRFDLSRLMSASLATVTRHPSFECLWQPPIPDDADRQAMVAQAAVPFNEAA